MRLKSIKLAGFKSFVDPTTVPFPSDRCAVVGPNGCGKSNVIDAVRWVMGESSAKQLRGEALTDVIFSGSSARKPNAQASIELIFDNSDGRAGGEYASYAEISVRRRVSRDGQSDYYLNGTKCRRRDIHDIFLGTGLGPRSYAIIEQGMISQIVESKPDELRVYLEEAAGISRYKERRRETENRIRHTRDNLDRLNDLRDELERQLAHLKRQSAAAEKYRELKAEEREVRGQLLALRWQKLDAEAQAADGVIRSRENDLEKHIAEQRRLEAEIETQRAQLAALNETLGEVQGRYYGIGADIARAEENIAARKSRLADLERDSDETEARHKDATYHLSVDNTRLEELGADLESMEPAVAAARERRDVAESARLEAEQAMQDWQSRWDTFNARAQEPLRTAEVESSRVTYLGELLERLAGRQSQLADEAAALEGDDSAARVAAIEPLLEEAVREVQALTDQREALASRQLDLRNEIASSEQALGDARRELSRLDGARASLEALQAASLEPTDAGAAEWLAGQGAGRERLADQLRVATGWESAVERVLGTFLGAATVDDLDRLELAAAPHSVAVLERRDDAPNAAADGAWTPLSAKVDSRLPLGSLLAGIYAIDDLDTALRRRRALRGGESIVTPDGTWVGKHWVLTATDADADDSVLRRGQEIEALGEAIADQEKAIRQQEQSLGTLREALDQAAREDRALNESLTAASDALGTRRGDVAALKARAEDIAGRQARLAAERAEVAAQVTAESANRDTAQATLAGARRQVSADEAERTRLEAERDQLRERLAEAQAHASRERDDNHQVELKRQFVDNQITSTRAAIDRLTTQIADLATRRTDLAKLTTEVRDPLPELEQAMTAQLDARLKVEAELTEVRRSVEAQDETLRELGTARSAAEEAAQAVRADLEAKRLAWRELDVRRGTLVEQLTEQDLTLETVLGTLPEEATEADWDERLTRISNRIQRLGAINLAAIDEFKDASERKTYLDAQHADLTEALETLETAIRKIDRETRTRFKETFDKVNSRFGELFPKLFGGGHAYLELTGEDLLDTGVAIMARPPGKRNSSIHLLSGGEKALTAISLVFAIFHLNPAPFCMLDEVDAPLDDANCERFSQIVKEMSETVQMIFITHNKITMEIAEQLMGITMHEPGVSRLVSVDLEEAAAMAIA